ncbi:transporter [Sphingomonas sp. PL-96]|uniref:transporter n=1 Tax=Sphingomonas sp. PL-96 TaxID=2887201 RepID=UPI001E538BB6|nr:transporter [Sphingomonas sp. PL-96]MCC2976954.1 transporter [Sphingomonas sp. PL-96]
MALLCPVAAQARDYCPTRPSLGQSPCVLDQGAVAVETALVDWEHDRSADERTDTLLIADTLLRFGVSDRAELQLEWQPFGREVTRDRVLGETERQNRVGDLTLGARVNLANPDGSGFSWAVQPSVTLPVGRQPIGGGDWGASLIVPLSYELNDTFTLQLSPEVAAEANEDGHGRHLAYGNIVGLEVALTDALAMELEGEVRRDDDPVEAATEVRAALSFGWMVNDDTQLDLGTAAGLNHDTPDLRLYAGVARRF